MQMDVCECTAVSALVLCMAFFKANLLQYCHVMLSLAKLHRQSFIYVTMGRAVAACAATARGIGHVSVVMNLCIPSHIFKHICVGTTILARLRCVNDSICQRCQSNVSAVSGQCERCVRAVSSLCQQFVHSSVVYAGPSERYVV